MKASPNPSEGGELFSPFGGVRGGWLFWQLSESGFAGFWDWLDRIILLILQAVRFASLGRKVFVYIGRIPMGMRPASVRFFYRAIMPNGIQILLIF